MTPGKGAISDLRVVGVEKAPKKTPRRGDPVRTFAYALNKYQFPFPDAPRWHKSSAYYLACFAHSAQTDQAGNPYIMHPKQVQHIAMTTLPIPLHEAGLHKLVHDAAYLHDVIEDTPFTLDDLRLHGAPPRLIDTIALLTRPTRDSRVDYTPLENLAFRDGYYLALAADAVARHVKLADISHNTLPKRLSLLPVDTQRRFIRKYTHALEVILSVPEPAPVPHVLPPGFPASPQPVPDRYLADYRGPAQSLLPSATLPRTDDTVSSEPPEEGTVPPQNTDAATDDP